MKFVYDDGGRAAAGYIGDTRDCVCRAIAIAAQRPYKEVYDLINKYAKSERITKRNPKRSNARTGCRKETAQKILEHYGFTWVATMHIGQGCTVHLRENELPKVALCATFRGTLSPLLTAYCTIHTIAPATAPVAFTATTSTRTRHATNRKAKTKRRLSAKTLRRCCGRRALMSPMSYIK